VNLLWELEEALHFQHHVWKVAVKPLFKIPFLREAVWYRLAKRFPRLSLFVRRPL
jgi:hypothetical protein